MSKHRIERKVLPLLILILFFSACSLFQSYQKKLIGKYMQLDKLIQGASILKLFADNSFYVSNQGEDGAVYSEGTWNVDGKYLLLYFNSKHSTRMSAGKNCDVIEKITDVDSTFFKVSFKDEATPFVEVIYKTQDSIYKQRTDYYGLIQIPKREIDSISVQFISSDIVTYSVKNKKSNYFIINLYEMKGEFVAKYFPDTLKLLIKGDKLFTDEAYKDTAHWDNYAGTNHYERVNE